MIYKSCTLAAVLVVATWLGSNSVLAEHPAPIPPAYVSDVGLAECPIIVVGKWDGAAFVDEGVVEGNVRVKHQIRTSILIERVIKGDIKPGEHSILVGYAIRWSRAAPTVQSFTSTHMIGDARATDSTIWFLDWKRSIVTEDETEHLSLENYRGVQPFELENYFCALCSDEPLKSITKLLDADNAEQVVRSLRFICGDDYPFYIGLQRGKRKRVRKSAPHLAVDIKPLLNHENPRIRNSAAWSYSDLLGDESSHEMQNLLDDNAPEVIAIAIASLVANNNWDSLGLIHAAIGNTEGWPGCQLTGYLKDLPDDRVVPLLIRMLQTAGPNRYSITGVSAQEALLERTGVRFPFDIKESLSAWANVRGATEESAAALNDLKLQLKRPLEAQLLGTPEAPRIRVENVSDHEVNLTSLPRNMTITSPGSSSSGTSMISETHHLDEATTVCLKPGESSEFSVRKIAQRFCNCKAEDRSIQIDYDLHDLPLVKTTFAGTLTVKTGDEFGK